MKKSLEEIQTGYFARKWLIEQKLDYPVFTKLKEKALNHPINRVEENIKNL